MPYYDETTGLWYDEEGNVVPAPTEGGTQRGAGTYGASGAPTTIDPGTGDITWNIPAPGRTERFQGDIQDLGYQLAISGASLERAEQQLGERFDAGEYFRQINLYRNTVWAMEHGDRYLGGRQLPGALADVPAFTEALQQQPRGAEGLQTALQEPTAPTPTDQQQQLGVPDQEGTVPFNPQAEPNRLEYNRRLAARPDLQTQGYRPIPENYDISQQGFMQAAPEMAAPMGAPTEAGVSEAERYYPSELEFGLTVDQEYTRMNSADPNRWPVNNAENRARLQRQAMANVLQQYGFSSLEEMMAGAPAPPDTFDFDQAMGMMEGFMDYGPDFMDLFATLPEGAGIAEGMSSEMEWWEGLTPEEQDQWMGMVTGGAPEAEEEVFGMDWRLMGALDQETGVSLDDSMERAITLGASGDELNDLRLGFQGQEAGMAEMGTATGRIRDFIGLTNDAGIVYRYGYEGQVVDDPGTPDHQRVAYDCSSWASEYFNQLYNLNIRFTTASLLGTDAGSAEGHNGLFRRVTAEDLKPNDLIVLPAVGEIPAHMGVYMGNGQVANMSSPANGAAIAQQDGFVRGRTPVYYRYAEEEEARPVTVSTADISSYLNTLTTTEEYDAAWTGAGGTVISGERFGFGELSDEAMHRRMYAIEHPAPTLEDGTPREQLAQWVVNAEAFTGEPVPNSVAKVPSTPEDVLFIINWVMDTGADWPWWWFDLEEDKKTQVLEALNTVAQGSVNYAF